MKVMMYQRMPKLRAASVVLRRVEKKKASSVNAVDVSMNSVKYLTGQNCSLRRVCMHIIREVKRGGFEGATP